MRKLITSVFIIFFLSPAAAQTDCGPSSCSPSCDSSCSYSVCETEQVVSGEITSLPYSFPGTPSGACSGYVSATTLKNLPGKIGSESIQKLPHSLKIKYKVCRSEVSHGPSCPPPQPSSTPESAK